LKGITEIDPYRFKHEDTAIFDGREALHIEKIRNEFFARIKELLITCRFAESKKPVAPPVMNALLLSMLEIVDPIFSQGTLREYGKLYGQIYVFDTVLAYFCCI